MEDVLKHAFDTTLVGLFALLLYAGAAMAALPRTRKAIQALDADKWLARAGLVVLPVAYVVGSISSAAGDALFNEPPPGTVWAAEWVTGRFGFAIQSDALTRYDVYASPEADACGVEVPAHSAAMDAREVFCARPRNAGVQSDPARYAYSGRLKPLYAYEKFRLLGADRAATELHAVHEHLAILRGAAAHGYALMWIGIGGCFIASLAALVALPRPGAGPATLDRALQAVGLPPDHLPARRRRARTPRQTVRLEIAWPPGAVDATERAGAPIPAVPPPAARAAATDASGTPAHTAARANGA